jgi:hypothetical protein
LAEQIRELFPGSSLTRRGGELYIMAAKKKGGKKKPGKKGGKK